MFPVNLCVDGRLAVVVGAGKVAFRKAESLLAAGARVRVVGKRFAAEFDALDGVEKVRGAYKRSLLSGASVVIAATNDDKVNARVARDAREERILVNVVDVPDLCDFIFPAVVQKGNIAVAVSTGGASPILARRLKDEIAGVLDDAYEGLAEVLATVRPRALREIRDPARRRAFLEKLAGDDFLDIVRTRGSRYALEEASRLLDDELKVRTRGGGHDA